MQQKSQEKSQAIQTLCKQLQVTVAAEQIINEKGMIKLVVLYSDNEKYPADEPEANQADIAQAKPPLTTKENENKS